MSAENLSNIIWRALSGSQRRLSVGTRRTRRYARDFPALFAFEDPASPDFASFDAHCEAGDHLYCTQWTGPAPGGWKIDVDTKVVAMIWRGDRPVAGDSGAIERLDDSHVDEMRALARLARPGPFAQKPMGLGEWWGVFDGGRLVAMAGERLHAGNLHEVSGICTHPDAQGRGLGRALTLAIVRRQLDRGELPFLHVMPENARALGLYRRLGFETEREVPLRVVSRT
jgi:ribosomal protein S18 acetylase RimI-like enzyme